MVTLKKLELTEAIKARLAIVEKAAEYANGGGAPLTYGDVDRLRLELANEVIAEVARQQMVRAARIHDLDRRIVRKPAVVVEVSLRPKRKQQA